MTVACITAIPCTLTGQTVHQFTRTGTIIEHGDTLTMIRVRRDSVSHAMRHDTTVILLRGDSAFRLRPAPARLMPLALTKYYRALITEAREKEKLEQRLGVPLNKPRSPGS